MTESEFLQTFANSIIGALPPLFHLQLHRDIPA